MEQKWRKGNAHTKNSTGSTHIPGAKKPQINKQRYAIAVNRKPNLEQRKREPPVLEKTAAKSVAQTNLKESKS